MKTVLSKKQAAILRRYADSFLEGGKTVKVKTPSGRIQEVSCGYLLRKFGAVVLLRKKRNERIAFV
jgi:hypothetical protein